MKRLMLLGALMLSACATHWGYRDYVNSFIGKNSDAVLLDFGAPQGTTPSSGGGRVVTYQSAPRNIMLPTAYGLIGNTLSCKTIFLVGADNIVKAASYEGGDCKK